MANKMKSLFHDPAHYTKSFAAFIALSETFDVLRSVMENVFGEAVVAKLQVNLNSQEELRVLGVGSGSGEKDFCMLTKLLQRFPRINNRVIEPAKDQLIRYKALVENKAHELHGVSCDLQQQTIEEYEKAGDLTKFHLISAVHSLYYVNDVDNTLMYLYNRLEPGGMMFVVLIADDSGCARFRDRFTDLQDNLIHNINSATIRSSLERWGIPYVFYHQPRQKDITLCLDDASENSRLVVDFLTQVINFQENAPKEQQEEVMEYIASSDCSDTTSDGQVLFNDDWGVVIFGKPLE